MLTSTHSQFFSDYAPFMQSIATLYFGGIAICSTYQPLADLLFDIKPTKTEVISELSIRINTTLLDTDDFRNIVDAAEIELNRDLCLTEDENLCFEYKKRFREFINGVEKEKATLKYFSHHFLYMFLFCIGFLVAIPALPNILDIRIYRVTVLFSILSIFYPIFFYRLSTFITNKIKKNKKY